MTPPLSQAEGFSPAHVVLHQSGSAIREPGGGPVWGFSKRAFDLVVSSLLVLLLAPLLLAVAAAIKLESRGPVLSRDRRLGRDMRAFGVLRFRTARDGVTTRVGSLLRRTSVAELPQLLNVVGGTMSLIGPRPAMNYELEHYRARHYERFLVRPGLAGLFQVSDGPELGLDAMLDLDAKYAETYGPLVDARILLRTPLALLRGAA
jgi:lipopolysaccharide/colanic/teichoic acid biosynthesis glycosyltransferase